MIYLKNKITDSIIQIFQELKKPWPTEKNNLNPVLGWVETEVNLYVFESGKRLIHINILFTLCYPNFLFNLEETYLRLVITH